MAGHEIDGTGLQIYGYFCCKTGVFRHAAPEEITHLPMSLQVFEIVRYYGEQKVLDKVTFDLGQAEIVGLLGPNGAGKSTLMKVITGYLPPYSGHVRVAGYDVSANALNVRRNIGYLPENNPLYTEMYVKEYLYFLAGIHQVGTNTQKSISDLITQTGLAGEQQKKIGQLSKGYRQRVGLAGALIHNPGVLILDEPTTGLDPNQIIEIRELIRQAGKEKTVLLSTHIMQEVEALCKRVLIIDKGRIVADDLIENIKRPATLQQTILVEFDKQPNPDQLQLIEGVREVTQLEGMVWCFIPQDDLDLRQQIFRFAVENNLAVLSMQKKDIPLESIFRSLTQE